MNSTIVLQPMIIIKLATNEVKWKRNMPSQRSQPSGVNTVDANTIGPTQQVP